MNDPRPTVPFPIVGIGASAGGLAALKELLSNVPEDTGLAYVVVVHLSPEHESHLHHLLQPHVKMPVQQVTETVRLEPNNVYVIPPNANLNTIDTHLRLTELEAARSQRAPIDHFFHTLAESHDGQAIGIVLTGSGSDGTQGLREIKAHGGLTVVQDPAEAEYDGMPRSAIAAVPVDLVLPLASIPAAVLRFAHTEPRLSVPEEGEDPDADSRQLLHKVFAQIRARTGRDFTHYKSSTLLRRITRRMQFNHVQEPSEYLELLRSKPKEVHALADDVLITVTSFFRDPAVFEALETEVIPQLLDAEHAEQGLRVWSVGCATGEEAYSLAILLLEQAARRGVTVPIQVFASDLHVESLERAREGLYPADIEADVRPDRLERFFVKESGGYRVRKEVRELVIFAAHNVLADPPFSRLDLVSCRNLLIYLKRDLQQKVTELFHYALRPDGFVVLGTSETLELADLFRVENKTCCIYRRRNFPAREPRLPVFPLTHAHIGGDGIGHRSDLPVEPQPAFGAFHQRMVEQHGPPSVLVSPDDRVVHLSEHAGRYLVHPGGGPTTILFKLVREELRIELRSALTAARSQRKIVRTRPVMVEFNGEASHIVVDVRPSLDPDEEGFVLVMFDERPRVEAELESGSDHDETLNAEGGLPARLRGLEAEKQLAEQRLQAIIEEYETSQEEIKASNEELQSANEELRSTLEELETSKEELQSMNEELQSVNQENRHKVDELSQLSSDLQNLLVATDIATLFLDRDQRILRFTPKIGELFNVRMADRGRALSDFTHRLGYDDLQKDAKQVLERLVPISREVQDETGRWYLTRVLPYRSQEDRIAGVVVTFVDITHQKRSAEEARRAKEYAEQILDALPGPLLVLGEGHRVQSANAAFYSQLETSPESTIGRRIYELGRGEWNLPAIHELLEDVLPREGAFEGHELELELEGIGRRVMLLRGRYLSDQELILLGIHDITQRFDAVEALRESEQRSRLLGLVADYSPDFIAVADVDGTPIFVNDAARSLVGLGSDEARRMELAEYFVPEDRPRVRDEVLPKTLSEGRWTGELHMRHVATEAEIPVLCSAFRVDDPADGTPIAFATLARDLTEQKRAESALRDREARYRALAELSPEAIMVVSDERYVYANEAAVQLLGAEGPEDLVGHSVYELLDPTAHAVVRNRIRHVLEEQRATERRAYGWQRLDGTQADVEIVAGPIHWEDGPAVQVLARDVTERERAEEALRTSEAQLAAELTAMQRLHGLVERLLVSSDFDAALHDVLLATMEITGATMGNLQLLDASRSTLEIVAQHGAGPEFLDRFAAVRADDDSVCARALRSLERVVVEDMTTDPASESMREIAAASGFRSVQSTPLRSRGGEPLGMLSTHHAEPYRYSDRDLRLLDIYTRLLADFIDRSRADAALRDSEARLGEENRHKDEYLAMLGHELRNPLAVIHSATELMQLAELEDPRLTKAVTVIERQSSHMARIIDGLLEVSRIARGKVDLEPRPLDLRDVVERVLDDRAEAISAHGLELVRPSAAEPLWIDGDETRLAQVFGNLVDNAVKFTPPPGTIEVSVARDGASAVVRVRDSGVGIRPKMLSRIFESFAQEAQDVARSAGGLGLGLALAKGLVDLHGGTIAASSDGPGTGAELEVRLPLREAPTTRRVEDSPPEVGPRRILVVEDNADAAYMLSELLQMEGHQVTTVDTGADALELLREHGADVVLCDLGLPGMSGHEVARAIRNDPSLRELPLVALTGYGQPEDRERSAAAGFDAHLVKPVSLPLLNAVLRRLAQS